MVSGGIILGGAVLLFLLDFVAWKGSQTYKGRAASIMAIFLSPICAAIALLAAVVVGYAQFKLCKDVTDTNVWSGTCQQFLGTDNFLGMIIGSSSAGLAGVLLIIYAISERIQMRRRDVDSMVDDVKVRPTKAPPRATKSDP
ncbi:hypothetical protein BGZ73_003338 [Actinomortierella ambigua]|nr:hypothetical protein BGZ73_003338 [Actinomortierella ambigua]